MDDYMKMAFEIVKAQATTKAMTVSEMMEMAQDLASGMKAMAAGTESVIPVESARPVMDSKKSIKENSVTCLECGKTMKLLTAKHLAAHGLTKKEYLAKYGMKKGTSLLAKGLARARKEKMKSMELWKRRGPAKASGAAKTAAPKAAAKPPKKAAPAKTK